MTIPVTIFTSFPGSGGATPLNRILGELGERHRSLPLERVIMETIGLTDPAPVARTFFVDDAIGRDCLLDPSITVFDARHAPQQFDAHPQARARVGFANSILLSETELVSADVVDAPVMRLRRMNPRACVKQVHFGEAPVDELLDISGFNLTSILEVAPVLLEDEEHRQGDHIGSFAWQDERSFDPARLDLPAGLAG